MNAVRILTHIDSETLHLPELRPFIGKAVELIVMDAPERPAAEPPARGKRLLGQDAGKIRIADDFDELDPECRRAFEGEEKDP